MHQRENKILIFLFIMINILTYVEIILVKFFNPITVLVLGPYFYVLRVKRVYVLCSGSLN